jgi:two-component system, NarL family, nitrate/nitrite response regulator NarL
MHHVSKAATTTIRAQIVAEPIVAWGLERLVQSAHPRCEVAGSCARVAECLASLNQGAADVALLDLDGDQGADAVTELFAQAGVKILAISGSRDAALHDGAVLGGARGVVQKRDSPALLLKAIEKVYDGELWVDRAATSRIFMELARQKAARNLDPEQHRIATLTPRERLSIAALASDAAAPGRVIAARLHISEHTLRNHLTSIYSKLGVANRLALYAYAHQHGLDTVD